MGLVTDSSMISKKAEMNTLGAETSGGRNVRELAFLKTLAGKNFCKIFFYKLGRKEKEKKKNSNRL